MGDELCYQIQYIHQTKRKNRLSYEGIALIVIVVAVNKRFCCKVKKVEVGLINEGELFVNNE
ncbi:hypothetical protein BK708_29090 [Bacillus thuringiensis serovar yunnanensis]|nr:hypothetical protein BK708_29090 [Bacillus thuringiensis serovar yunnanensis]